jgi:antitoxin component YwqK of YwqJK toxin-antitoxin module
MQPFVIRSDSMSQLRVAQFLLGLVGLALAVVFFLNRFGRAGGTDLLSLPTANRQQLENRQGQFFLTGGVHAFTGWMIDNHADGTVKLRTSLVDGRLHGISEGWHSNGVQELREAFNQGLAEGVRTTWYPNGRQRSEGTLVAGLQQGEFRQWYESGVLAARVEFKDGKPHGRSQAWFPSGYLKAEALMSQGQVSARHFYQDGEQRVPTLLAGASTP